MRSIVTQLFIKPATDALIQSVGSLPVQNLQIVGQKKSQPLRSMLLMTEDLENYWDVKAGSFRENIVLKNFDLFSLSSGDEIMIGDVKIRITFRCEPCKKMVHIATVEKLKGKRGILGEFLNDGEILVGDECVILTKKKFEEIPYEYYERIAWYLDAKVNTTIKASELLWNCGVAPGLVRVLPQIMEKHVMKGRSKVVFVSH